jgi:hypothetical protein
VNDRTNHLIAWGAGAIVLFCVVAAYVVAPKLASRKFISAFEWELTDGKLIQRQEDSPTIEIPLTQIESISTFLGWLIVKGGTPTRQLAVPHEINDFEDLKSQLSSYHAVTPVKLWVSPFFLLLSGLLIAAYILLLVSHSHPVVLISGLTALALQGYSFFRLLQLSRFRKKALVFCCILSWFLIAWVVYLRVHAAS